MSEPSPELSIGASLRFGFRRLRERPGQCLWLGAITISYSAAQRASEQLVDALAEQFPDASGWGDAAGLVMTLVLGAVAFVIDCNVARASLDLARRGRHAVPLVVPSGHWVRYGFAKLIVVSGVVLGGLLGIAPGLMVLARYPFAWLVIADRGAGLRESLAASARLTAGARWQVLGLCLACGALNALGLVCFLVGVIATRAITIVAFAHFYDELLERHRGLPASAAEAAAAEVVVDTAMGPVSVDAEPASRT